MVFKRFYIESTIRILILALTLFLITYLLHKEGYYLSLINLVLFLVIQVVLLIISVNRSNKTVHHFLQMAFQMEFNEITNTRFRDKSFEKLHITIEKIKERFRKIQHENAGLKEYYQNMLNLTEAGIISIAKDGRITFSNRYANNFFGKEELISLQHMKKINPELVAHLENVKPGESRESKIVMPDGIKKIVFRMNESRLENKEIKLVAFQPVDRILNNKELKTLGNMSRILNHEIMNSLAPILSSVSTLKEFSRSTDIHSDEKKMYREKISRGLNIIEQRGQSLKDFVDSFRKIQMVPLPEKKDFDMAEMIRDMLHLYAIEFKNNQIQINSEIPESISCAADKKQLEQVIINLLNNSIQAVKSMQTKNIKISLRKTGTNVQLEIEDTGHGIEEEEKDMIFLPFYTNRDGGSGIGLSLVRQIVFNHGGEIQLYSTVGKGSKFRIIL